MTDDNKLKVLFAPAWYPPRENQKAVNGTFIREHVMAVSRYEDVRVLIFRRKDNGRGYSRHHYIDNGVQTFDVTCPYHDISILHKVSRKYLWLRSLRWATRGWGKPDIFHFHDMSSYYGGVTARLMGVPYVVSQYWTGFMKGLITPIWLKRFNKSLKHARIVLASSLEAPNYLKEYGIKADVCWFPNAFNSEIFYPGKTTTDTLNLLHVSDFTEQKRVPDIVEAFRIVLESYPHATLRIVGDGSARSALEALADERLPAGSFCFTGFLPKHLVAGEMRNSKGLILPSSSETFGCVLMEAMACGCPVLTTRVGGIPAVVRNGEGLFVDIGDIEAIADGMIRMLSGEHGLNTERISTTAAERFSREVVGMKLHCIHKWASGESHYSPRVGMFLQ